jgi:predicted exporter
MSTILHVTFIYFAIGLGVNFLSFFIPACKSDQSLTNLLIWLTVSCCWLMWIITYMMQLNPLVAPIPIAE